MFAEASQAFAFEPSSKSVSVVQLPVLVFALARLVESASSFSLLVVVMLLPSLELADFRSQTLKTQACLDHHHQTPLIAAQWDDWEDHFPVLELTMQAVFQCLNDRYCLLQAQAPAQQQ